MIHQVPETSRIVHVTVKVEIDLGGLQPHQEDDLAEAAAKAAREAVCATFMEHGHVFHKQQTWDVGPSAYRLTEERT